MLDFILRRLSLTKKAQKTELSPKIGQELVTKWLRSIGWKHEIQFYAEDYLPIRVFKDWKGVSLEISLRSPQAWITVFGPGHFDVTPSKAYTDHGLDPSVLEWVKDKVCMVVQAPNAELMSLMDAQGYETQSMGSQFYIYLDPKTLGVNFVAQPWNYKEGLAAVVVPIWKSVSSKRP